MIDHRKSVEELYESFEVLVQQYSWKKEEMYKLDDYSVFTYITPKSGNSIWLTSGIHGEEPAGPIAISESIDFLGKLGKQYPLVLRPLCNPLGYSKNTRYFSGEGDWKKGKSVSDLPEFRKNIVNMYESYPCLISIDLHEDADPKVTPDKFYIYSQGKSGLDDPVAKAVFETFKKTGMNYLENGKTRFGEEVRNGMIGPVGDSSIDEFIASLGCPTVIVTETPGGLDLRTRIEAQKAVVKSLYKYASLVSGW